MNEGKKCVVTGNAPKLKRRGRRDEGENLRRIKRLERSFRESCNEIWDRFLKKNRVDDLEKRRYTY